jgi:uncharacterized Zn finger protein
MVVATLTEKKIRQSASIESFERGFAYYEQGAVLSLIRRGGIVQATVQGSSVQPYTVRCTEETGGFTVSCNCPYEAGGWCKHIVATCLCIVHQPELIEERPALDTLLAQLDRDHLQSLLLHLVERDSALLDVIETFIQPAQAAARVTSANSKKKTTRNVSSDHAAQNIRRQVRSIMHSLDRLSSSEAYWHIQSVVDDVRGLLQDQVWPLIEADDGRAALPLLDALTREYLEDWVDLDDSDAVASDFFAELTMAWTEALLSADLSQKERKAWHKLLDGWQREVDDYGLDDVFEAARDAAIQGWDYSPLQQILQGQITTRKGSVGQFPERQDALTVARLNILGRRGRLQEYLYLAEAEGHTDAYVAMLVRLNRVQEAMDYGIAHLSTAHEAFNLARELYQRHEREKAFQIAERGLTLQGPASTLAKWLRDEAAATGDLTRALVAAQVAFREEISLANYLRTAGFAGEQWPHLREELLTIARQASWYTEGRVDVFLHEGLIDDAIKVVGTGVYYAEVAKVVDAALLSRPEWAMQATRKQAEDIMDRGKAELYSAAANWLAKTRTAYHNMGREDDWQAYLNELLAKHWRKYKLVPLLRALQ